MGAVLIKTKGEDRIRPKVAVVLSSGSMKAISSLALFEFLDEQEIEIDLLIGCSGGGIMSALRVSGYDHQQTMDFASQFSAIKPFSHINYKTLLNIANLPFGRFDIASGLLKRNASMKFCREVFGERRLEEMQSGLLLQATDFQSGEGVVLSHGMLAETVYASSAFAPLLPPIQIDGRWLVDGGYSSVLPVIEAVKRDADVIIAMLFLEKLVEQPKHFLEGFHNVSRAFALSMVKSQLALSIDFHHHEIIVINVPFEKPVSMTERSKMSEIVDVGRRAVDAKKDEILHAIAHYTAR